MSAYYNENDPFAAQWLRNLITNNLIAPGEVDERDIQDVRPIDLMEFTQCHFFAGIGLWSLALRQAGWGDDRPVWTGSCPCQPFSAAGKALGFDDERHLWPHWFHLVEECRPSIVFGEQVASKAGLSWFDLVSADLEGLDYACGAVPFPAAGVGAPNLRDRLYWLAVSPWQQHHGSGDTGARRGLEPANGSDPSKLAVSGSTGGRRNAGTVFREETEGQSGRQNAWNQSNEFVVSGDPSKLAVSDQPGPQGQRVNGYGREQWTVGPGSVAGILGDTESGGRRERGYATQSGSERHFDRTSPVNGFWRNADWISCTDGKWRPVEPGTFPLVDGYPNRVGLLRAYGNAINVEQAKAFVEAALDCL